MACRRQCVSKLIADNAQSLLDGAGANFGMTGVSSSAARPQITTVDDPTDVPSSASTELPDLDQLTKELEELEKELDEETRQPETGKCDCPACDPDKDTVEERLFHPVDQWQHAVDVASDVHDAAGSLEHALFELGENPLAFEASMILSQSLTLLRAIQRKRKEVAE